VVKCRGSVELSATIELSSDEENDESMYSIDSDHATVKSAKMNVYMFSKFMSDLEELIDVEQPSFEKKIEELSSNISNGGGGGKNSMGNRKDSGMSLTKTNSKSLLEAGSDDDSDGESEAEDDEEEEREIERFAHIDSIVKQANMKRCRGRWSTRDIHDVKFNEDKLVKCSYEWQEH
jgi:cancer susceptibility candidate protein 1